MTKYQRVKPDGSEEWVDNLKDASTDYEDAVKVDRGKLLKDGVVTKLVEVPDKSGKQHRSKRAISKDLKIRLTCFSLTSSSIVPKTA
jgi:hypothetical protein